MKNFHACDDFFRLLVEAYVIALAMNTAGCNTIDFFRVWLSQSDWPDLINDIKSLCGPFAVSSIRAKAERDIKEVVEILLATTKVKWETTQVLPESLSVPNWDEVETELRAEFTSHSRDIYRENALIIISCGLLYLDFRDACRKGYSVRIKKCIEMFVILFQGTNFKNYTPRK